MINFNYCLARSVPRVFFSPVRPPSACVRSFTCLRVRSLKSHNKSASVLVRACTSASVPICLRSCVCVRCVHLIKSPDASARIISNASGRVFRSRTFEVYYRYCCTLITHENVQNSVYLVVSLLYARAHTE